MKRTQPWQEADMTSLPAERTAAASTASMWSIEYYKTYFDVDTAQVVARLRNSVWPHKNDFLRRIDNNSDLYGWHSAKAWQ